MEATEVLRDEHGYPLYEYDSNACCDKCGKKNLWHAEHDRQTGHRKGYCPDCKWWTQYSLFAKNLHRMYNEIMGHPQGWRAPQVLHSECVG